MLEQLIAEDMKLNNRSSDREDDCIDSSMKPVQLKPSLINRVLPALGDAMITAGLKLKYRSITALKTESSHAPDFLIML